MQDLDQPYHGSADFQKGSPTPVSTVNFINRGPKPIGLLIFGGLEEDNPGIERQPAADTSSQLPAASGIDGRRHKTPGETGQ